MSSVGEPIAVVGVGCRFSGDVDTPSKFWELLRQPRNVASKIPPDRFNLRRFYNPDRMNHGTTNVKESYFLSGDIRSFDAQFFNIPPTEADAIDPQQRMLLETVYEALENGGIPMEQLRGTDTAVYVGLMCHDYAALANRDLNSINTHSPSSRLLEAEFSQPLFTAVQLVLVDLLRAVGVKFKAAVGHSSGEIAAAYAAGFFNSSDAIRIAYYRGLYAKFAAGPSGEKGAMLAVGTSLEDAQEFCALDDFKETLTIAASNAPLSVTLSGNEDAINQAKVVFEEEKRFVRRLRVDTAYHSHHMAPCCEPYAKSLRDCRISILAPPEDAPAWYSSVTGSVMIPNEQLQGSYWVDNMKNTVLFSQALESAVSECKSFGMALEVGPHPALKGPATQTIEAISGISVQYSGTLSREKDDVDSFTEALSVLWTAYGESGVSFSKLRNLYEREGVSFAFIQNLPTYPWDHEQTYWAESRSAKLFRTGDFANSKLLGVRTADGTDEEWRWQNLLKIKEIPWISDHKLQGQAVFPASGYIELAIEAAIQITEKQTIQYIELQHLRILKALVIDDAIGTETLVTMTGIDREERKKNVIFAEFTSYSAAGRESSKMVTNAQGKIMIKLGITNKDIFPPRVPQQLELSEVKLDSFYSSLAEAGFGYDGPFKGLVTLRRRLGRSSGSILCPPKDELVDSTIFHPAVLDNAMQSVLAAVGSPGDATIQTLHVPTGARKVTLVPSRCGHAISETVLFDSYVTGSNPKSITGDTDLFNSEGEKLISIEGLDIVPFVQPTKADDRQVFSENLWEVDRPDGQLALGDIRATDEEKQKAIDCERIAYYYLRTLDDAYEKSGIQIRPKPSALYENDIDARIMTAVGEALPAVVRGEINMLEVLTKEKILDIYYEQSLGYSLANVSIARMAKQVSHRYPHLNILEVGAGTGGATNAILEALGRAFRTYTFTDVSSGFFDNAQEKLKSFSNRMIFKTLDIELDPTSQGFSQHSYDMIIASNSLHVTKNLELTLKYVRKFLKPGGYLLLLEMDDEGPLRVALTFCGLPGWWVGRDDGRIYGPAAPFLRWNDLLKCTGFSGIVTYTQSKDPLALPLSVFASQAVDDDINFIRQPLRYQPRHSSANGILVLGGRSLATSKIIDEVDYLLSSRGFHVATFKSLEALEEIDLTHFPMVKNFLDLDLPIFEDITECRWKCLQRLTSSTRNMLWLTLMYERQNAYAAMSVGFVRSILYELPHLQIQLLDIDQSRTPTATTFVEFMLRLEYADLLRKNAPQKTILRTTEPELSLWDGKIRIRRVLPQKSRNDRYNSAKRSIVRGISLLDSAMEIEWENDAYILSEQMQFNMHQNTITIKSQTTTLLALAVLFVSDSNSSTIKVPESWSLPLNDEAVQHPRAYLTLIVAHVMTKWITNSAVFGSSILIHRADKLLSTALCMMEASHYKLHFSTCNPDDVFDGCIFVHPCSKRSDIEAILPCKLSLFLDFSTDSTTEESDSLSILKTLPESCRRSNWFSLLKRQSLMPSYLSKEMVATLLCEANTTVAGLISSKSHILQFPFVNLRDVPQLVATKPLCLIDWSTKATIPVSAKPIDAKGRSICNWMVNKGAKYIIVTSRTPSVPQEWIAMHKAKGVTVACVAGGIANRDSLDRARQEIEDSYPEIGGVANGALVLRDQVFENMDLGSFQTVVKPKVDGTSGQSAYTAANLFMKGIIGQRRSRGLAGSIINISRALGVGYLKGEVNIPTKQLQRLRYASLPMSERDLHQLFGEAVVAGRPNSNQDYDILRGFRQISERETDGIYWAKNIKLSHFVSYEDEFTGDIVSASSKPGIKIQLSTVNSMDAAQSVISDGFQAKIRASLRLSADERIDNSMPLIELGIDSIVAVEIRSWFLQELDVDMPVLRILGAPSIMDLILESIEKLPRKLQFKPLMVDRPEIPAIQMGPDSPTPSEPTPKDLSLTDIQTPISSSPTPSTTIHSTSDGKPSYAPDDSDANEILRIEPISGNFVPAARISPNMFFSKNDELCQGIMKTSQIRLEYVKVRDFGGCLEVFENTKNHVYDLKSGKTMKLTLCHTGSGEWYFVVGYPHICLDRISWAILSTELEAHYQQDHALPPPRQYHEWASRIRMDIQSGQLDQDRAFWRTEFSSQPSLLPLFPMSRSWRQPLPRYEQHFVDLNTGTDLLRLIKLRCSSERVSAFHFHLAVFKIMLFRMLNVGDICIGFSDSNRLEADDDRVIGVLLNSLPLRFRWDKTQTFNASVKEAQTKAFAAL
ncbi:putative PKS/NRPS-like protein biosynthetic cluster [Myotisia sp. PD_48]|nr:putative PKS/NRPS-like protein biosynthetic cluster [Myotisia sp. PD_48]